MSDDDFGLSSSDEADLLHLDGKIDSAAPKRNHDDDADSSSKRRRHGDVASPAISIANQILRQRFNIDSFRLQQEAAIAKLLDGESAVVVFPTGGGKSLCYQVPALCFQEMDRLAGIRQGPAGHGITLVVSPLIALMKDQVDALQRKNIKAAVMDSTKSTEEYLAIVDDMRKGALDIIYCAPERLNNEGFVASMANVKGGVRLLAVDEAHCISEWGHAFRPDYLKVARFCKEIGAERVVCLTATATPQVADDICNQFEVPKSGLFRTSTYRPNLKLSAESFQTKKDSYPRLMSFLKAHPGPTIIYVTTREQSEVLALKLTREGFKAEHFHAGMKVPDKIRVQDAFMASDSLIICVRISFILLISSLLLISSSLPGHHCFWNGHRQEQHSQCDPLRHSPQPGRIQPGDWKSWPRRARQPMRHVLVRRGFAPT
jgi:RecQ family ATP-dependent DNA helicase